MRTPVMTAVVFLLGLILGAVAGPRLVPGLQAQYGSKLKATPVVTAEGIVHCVTYGTDGISCVK